MRSDKRISALLVGVCTALYGASSAHAQDTANTVEQVLVTGSRIKRPEYEGNIPGVQVSAAEIEERAFTNLVDVLQDIPLVGTGANPLGTNGGQPSSLGVSFVDLLDLGTQRTLTLVNGRRYVSGNSASLFVFANETGSQVNVNTIPISLVERVDVLTVGGAVAYGSDAIAGVVNYVLKDDFEGFKTSFRGGESTRGDAGEYTVRATWGTNFNESRGNVFVNGEFNKIDGLQADSRSFRRNLPAQVTGFANGSRRNPDFAPAIIDIANLNNGAFLNAASDGIPGTGDLTSSRAVNISDAGVIFNVNNAINLGGASAIIGPAATTFTTGATQLIPGVPGACNPGGSVAARFCNFAPTALPTGVAPTDVFKAFGVTPPAGANAGQLTTLAINVLQANLPTAREYFAANPNIPLNAFLGTFIGAFPDIPNPDPATRAMLPRIAVPLRFNNNGDVETFNVATLKPDTPSSLGGAFGGDGFNAIRNTTLRVAQERSSVFAGGHYDITDNLTFFTENLYSLTRSHTIRGAASNNTAGSNTVENAAIIANINNPFLTDANRAALAAAGINASNPNFVLSRTNQDITADNRSENEDKTYRIVEGLRGSFEFLDRSFDWDASVALGRAKTTTQTTNIKDVEFALALDAARDANGNIVCRSQLSPAAAGQPIPGVAPNIVRVTGADGIPTEVLFTPTASAAQIAACKPLNPFGFNRSSNEARSYVLGRQEFKNDTRQTAAQANLSFPVVTLPAGELGFGSFFEYRKEELDFSVDQLSSQGRTRTAAIASTKGETETTEYGAEIRVPIFGGDWSFPALRSLDIGGGIRRVKQDGSAPTFRTTTGDVITQRADGDADDIYSIKATWAPLESLRFRGEMTRALRQPNVVELFLGGQPAFNGVTDPCGNQSINAGPNPAARRANCQAAVIAAGLATNPQEAASFLQGFRANNVNLQGTFAGNAGLVPEKADSWTAGVVFTPSFLRNLRASFDYISIDLKNIIFPTTQTQALNFCFDSGFPDTTAQFGTNLCAATPRTPAGQTGAFQLTNGFMLQYLNLAAREIRGVNSTIEYSFPLAGLFGAGGNLGNVGLDLNVYRLLNYRDSASGRFDDTTFSNGSLARPSWETNLGVTYNRDALDVRLTWNWTDSTRVFAGGAPASIESASPTGFSAYSVYDLSVGYKMSNRYQTRLSVVNLFDKNYLGRELDQLYIDQIGRRWSLTLSANF